MRLATFTSAGMTRIGVVVGDEVVDLSEAVPGLPREMCALFTAGIEALNVARRAAETSTARVPLAQVKLEAPILRPPKVLAVGINYADHVAETRGPDAKLPSCPVIFNKQATAVTGTREPIYLPRASRELDYEGELAVVIAKRCRHVPKNQAPGVVAGYAITNDVSVRDWQRRVPTLTMGKSFDTHCPFGPWIVTPDEVGDPHALDLRTWVNGELRQHSSTKHLIFGCFDLIEHLSSVFTLEPGDVISTGTPAGVGVAMSPPRFLEPGDVVKIAIEKIGAIENTVIEEPSDTIMY